MEKIRLTIKGVMFALFPDYDKTKPGSEELVEQVTERLGELNKKRPPVILVPEPDNVYDRKAIRGWCEGKPIGRVAADETAMAHRLFDDEHEMVMARIVEVEVRRKGNFFVEAELPEGASQNKKELPDYEHVWEQWQFDLPIFPQPESWKACRVEEFGIKMLLSASGEMDVEELMRCMKSWTDNSLHDFSKEAQQTRKEYINLLNSLGDKRLEPYIQRLKRQYGAIGGGHRMNYRMEWWNGLEQSKQMELYWDNWRSKRKEDNLYKDLLTVDTHLRRMPDGLYANIGDLKVLFSALRYRDVPRSILWNIYTLLLLRKRICRKLGIAMKPLPEDAYGVVDKVEVTSNEQPGELSTPDAKALCNKLCQAGIVDAGWQPIDLSNAEKGTLIEFVAEKLNIRNKWKFFGTLWKMDSETLRTAKARGLDQDKTWKFREQLNAL